MTDYEFGSDGQVRSAADSLRAFEDEHLGADAPRQAGQVERGHGSLFSRLPDDHRKHHSALEKAVVTEQKLSDARGTLAAAESDHKAALAACDQSRLGSG